MRKPILFLAILTCGALVRAEDVVTEPMGFNKVTCLPNSDTIVGLPLRTQGSIRSALASVPTVAGDAATLTLATNALTAGSLTGHFLKFIDGDRAGRWYDILTTPANTENSLTIDLNGDSLGAATTGNKVLIARYWTLDELFPPAGATTSWTLDTETGIQVPNGHAIVASTSRFSSGRRTEILLPDLQANGTNLAPSSTFYLFNGGWRKQGLPYTDNFGATIMYPDKYLTVRHPSSVAYSTVFRCLGEVEIGSFAVPFRTRPSETQDNSVGLPRPVNVALNDLGLTAPAFVASTSRFSSGRKDELLVFDNATSAFNKAPSRTYYYFNSGWRKQGESYLTDFGTDSIPAGGGFLIRKAADGVGSTMFWNNPAIFRPVP